MQGSEGVQLEGLTDNGGLMHDLRDSDQQG